VSLKDNNGNTPLDIALERDYKEIIEFFREKQTERDKCEKN